MKRICLTLVGIFLLFVHTFAQQTKQDSSSYKSRKLQLDEVHLVSSYYWQTGDHSAIEGGIGSEKVTDLANGLEVKWAGYDFMARKNELTLGFGLDHHTAASQAWVSQTGASKTGGTRIYPSVNWTRENEAKGTSFGFGAIYSSEYNYHSLGLDAQVSAKTHNNGEFTAKFSTYLDQVKLIRPSEFNTVDTVSNTTGGTITYTTASGQTVVLSPGTTYTGETGHHASIPSSPRDTYTASFSFSQVINSRLQGAVLLDLVAQNGYLGLPFHRVYFADGKDTTEVLPSTRYKLPIGLRLNYFLGDQVILRGYYRFYTDSWGIRSQTASLEVPVKITPFFSVSPFYRYYTQTAARYFAPYERHTENDSYWTSNYAYAAFTSSYFGTGIRLSPPAGIFHSSLKTLELRYGHYTQTTDLVSNVISLDLTFK
jgi:Protein of unknown function (DUF3570)